MEDTTVVFAQVPILKAQLEELKRLTGTLTTKDALHAAVNHYLNCPVINGSSEVEVEVKAKVKEQEQEQKKETEKDWWWSPEEKES